MFLLLRSRKPVFSWLGIYSPLYQGTLDAYSLLCVIFISSLLTTSYSNFNSDRHSRTLSCQPFFVPQYPCIVSHQDVCPDLIEKTCLTMRGGFLAERWGRQCPPLPCVSITNYVVFRLLLVGRGTGTSVSAKGLICFLGARLGEYCSKPGSRSRSVMTDLRSYSKAILNLRHLHQLSLHNACP